MLILTATQCFGISDGDIHPLLEGSGFSAAASAEGFGVVASDAGNVTATAGPWSEGVATGLDEPITSLLILSADPPCVLIGTEGAHVYRLDGMSARRVEAFDALACREQWHTPWGGPPAVRTLARSTEGVVYADIHVGSIMRSFDDGHTWEPVTPTLHEDVHEVATSPAASKRVVANTAAAVYVSDDCGESWSHRGEELGERYGRAVAVHPCRADVMLATVSDGPHGDDVHGQLYWTANAGKSWHHAAEGFPASTKENINTGHVAFTPDGRAWAAVGTRLYCSKDRGRTWPTHWQGEAEILQLAVPGPIR